ncbi:hypothetical protein Tco_0642477 [Tanacetum coccineum]
MNELPLFDSIYFEANNLPRSEFIVTLLREINEIAVPLSLSFDFVFLSEIFKSLSFCLDRLCHLAILCLDQHAHTLHHLESLLTISLDRLDIFEGRSCISEFVRKKSDFSWNEAFNISNLMYPEIKTVDSKKLLTGFPSQRRVSNTDVDRFTMLDFVLITGTSQSRQHVDTSLIHIESRKSPTAVLFDDDTGRISIRHYTFLSETSSFCWSQTSHTNSSDEILKPFFGKALVEPVRQLYILLFGIQLTNLSPRNCYSSRSAFDPEYQGNRHDLGASEKAVRSKPNPSRIPESHDECTS